MTDSIPKIPSIFSAVEKLRFLLTRKEKMTWVGIVLFAIASSVFEVLTTSFVVVFAQVLSQPGLGDQYLKKLEIYQQKYFPLFAIDFHLSANRFVFYLALIMGGIYLIKNILATIEIFYQNSSIQTMNVDFKNKLLHRYAKSDYGFYLTRNASTGLQVITTDVENMFSMGMLSLAGIVSEAIVFLGVLSMIILMNPILAVVIFTIGSLGSIIIIKGLLPYFYRWGQKSQEASLHNMKNLMQFFQGFKEMILLGKKDVFINAYQYYSRQKSYFQGLQMTALALPRMILELLFIGLLVLVVSFLCFQKETPGQMVGILGGYLYAGFRLMPGLNRIISHLNVFKSAIPCIERVFEEYNIICTKKQLVDVPNFTFHRSFVLKNIDFKYDEILPSALKNVSLTLKKGECIGIVGKTGAGKSTLVDIILGLLHPQAGEVIIDGQYPACSYQWHQKIGYVPQTIYLVDDTIEANIALGEQNIDQEKLRQAVEVAQLTTMIEQLPQHLKTVVGEQGVRLSGGERQRIAIARALYRQPEVLIFDEATSALDNETETYLMNMVNRVSKNHTVIMIAHRLTTLRYCDRIIMMEKGKIAKIVSYTDLQHV